MRISDWSSDVCSSDLTSDGWRDPTPDEQDAGEKAEEITEQYGVSVSGPIIKDRLHYFVTYEAKDFIVPRFIEPAAVVDQSALPSEITQYYGPRSEEHTSELPSLMRISYAVFCLKKKNK